MVSNNDLLLIREKLAAGRASLVVAKQEISDAKRAGVTDGIASLERQVKDLEAQIAQMESVYGRA